MTGLRSHVHSTGVVPRLLGTIALLVCALQSLDGEAAAGPAAPFAPQESWIRLATDQQLVVGAAPSGGIGEMSGNERPPLDKQGPELRGGRPVSLSFKPEIDASSASLQFREQSDTTEYVRIAQWTAAVLLLSGAAVIGLKRWTTAFKPGCSPSRRLALLETLPLGPRGSIALVQCDGRLALVGCDAHGIKTITFCPTFFEEAITSDDLHSVAMHDGVEEPGQPGRQPDSGLMAGVLSLSATQSFAGRPTGEKQISGGRVR